MKGGKEGDGSKKGAREDRTEYEESNYKINYFFSEGLALSICC
jgi:hypothetical protein